MRLIEFRLQPGLWNTVRSEQHGQDGGGNQSQQTAVLFDLYARLPGSIADGVGQTLVEAIVVLVRYLRAVPIW